MILNNLQELPLDNIGNDMWRATIGDKKLLIADPALVSNDKNVDEFYLKLPCKASMSDNSNGTITLTASDRHILVVAKQRLVISNADGTLGSIRIDQNAVSHSNVEFVERCGNPHNSFAFNDICGIVISAEYDEIPDTITHIVYNTLTSKYGVVISSDDEIGTGDMLDTTSTVTGMYVNTISATIDYGGIIEIPNISTVIGVKRKVWETSKTKSMVLLHEHLKTSVGSVDPCKVTLCTVISNDELAVVDTTNVGLLSSNWDKLLKITVDADPMQYLITFDKRTYSIYDGKWKPIISCNPDVHGGTGWSWHYFDGTSWVDNKRSDNLLHQIVDEMLKDGLSIEEFPDINTLADLTPEEINSKGGFVMRDSSYFDVLFLVPTGTSVISSVGVVVSETGFVSAPIGTDDGYSVLRKHDKGKQLHTIVKLSPGLENIVIDYI